MASDSQTPFRAENTGAAQAARSFVTQLHILLRTCQIHNIGNVALVRPVTNLMGILEEILFKLYKKCKDRA